MRWGLLAVGCVLLTVSVLADTLGLSRGEGFPEGQILTGTAGLLLLLSALEWRRIGLMWKLLGRMAMVVLAALLALKTLGSLTGALDPPEQQQILIREDLLPGMGSPLIFSPHVMWTTPEFPDVPQPGGEVWLYGASDALPPNGYTSFIDRRQPGYNSTQSLILLMLDLRYADPPETVVLTAGPADARSTLETGDPRFHTGYFRWMEATGSDYSLSMDLSGRELETAAAWTQQVNRTVLQALGREYSFQTVFCWGEGTTGSLTPSQRDFILAVDSLLGGF